MDWSPQQEQALKAVNWWYENSKEPVFYLAGYAGTGKTTLAKHLAEDTDTLFAAYTGKAALCLRKSGIPAASTIHKILYRPVRNKYKRIKELEDQIKQGPTTESVKELHDLKELKFVLRDDDSPIYDVDLLVLDECSMINEKLAKDLLSFDTKILVLGDPMQLPPVKGTGYFTKSEPDILLTEIHRQAKDNPIIALSMYVRENGYVPVDFADNAKRIGRQHLTSEILQNATQVLTGKNATRRKINAYMRTQLGFDSVYPTAGDRLICLRNSMKRNLLNGLFAEVVRSHGEVDLHSYGLDMTTELSEGKTLENVEMLSAYFQQYENDQALKAVPYKVTMDYEHFDYGYAITVHKSQGSQFDHVVLRDDGFLSWNNLQRTRWLYTAVTRAVESVIVV